MDSLPGSANILQVMITVMEINVFIDSTRSFKLDTIGTLK